tara:strand:- start:947 stop:1660 length:714 start_codon:yes stop_codon:yes gene_type:complete
LELVYSKETKIKNLSSGDDIIKMLNYLYVLLNVKKENQLNQIEESVLNGFIINNYKNFTIEEIKHAFRLAVAGELGIELFQKLDAITFGKVLLSYKEFKNNKIRQHLMKKKTVKKEITVEEINEIEQKFLDNCIKPYFDRRKEMTEPEISHGNKAIFDHYYKLGFIKMTDKEKDEYRAIAKKLWLIDRRSKGEKVDFESPIGNRGMKLFMSCIALYYKSFEILKNVEIDFKGWNDKL